MSDSGFRVMAFMFKVRDFFRPRKYMVQEIGIKEGFYVLDYGCGPGSYVKPVAELVGKSGRIFALDVQPLAVDLVKKLAVREGLVNVETILSDCKTGLASGSLDVVLLYDVFHHLSDPDCVLGELRRVLKPGGILSFSDHHMREDEILLKVASGGRFRLLRKGKRTYSFVKSG
jgi:ubiquinone/menaquinone biosynthesis C-methylase UbiE